MGYYTNFKITTHQGYIDLNNLKELLETQTGYSFEVGINVIYLFDAKWHDYMNNMEEISKEFPNSVIIVEGKGEDSDDLWRHYFKNGKSYKENAQIIFNEFNENELE